MAFQFDPVDGLMNSAQFPSNPTSEAAARQQFMTLFNQLKDYLAIMEGQSYPANGGNADMVDNKHASDFATASHNHYGVLAPINHTHYWGHIVDIPTNLVKNDIPRWGWSGTIPYNQNMYITHNLNTLTPLITWDSTSGNVNPTVKVENANQLYIGNYNDTGGNSCNITIRIW